jgi:hypothetical protein
MKIQRNIQARSRNHCCSGKATGITYSECVFIDVDTQDAIKMGYIIMWSIWLCNIFSKLSHKRQGFRKNVIKHQTDFSFFPTTFSETFLVLIRSERDMIKKMYIDLHVKYLLFPSDFNKSWIFSTEFSKNTQLSNSM